LVELLDKGNNRSVLAQSQAYKRKEIVKRLREFRQLFDHGVFKLSARGKTKQFQSWTTPIIEIATNFQSKFTEIGFCGIVFHLIYSPF
jgi:phosphoribosylformimino-5-aminoimidazole carboxamide ribonucleotide (ProFAR) isomerase